MNTTFNKNGLTLKIETDEYLRDPRKEFDNLGTMACFHNRYKLGDDHTLSIEEVKEIEDSKKYISLPLYLYDHSGITMRTTPFSCHWDSGKVGVIYVSKEQIRKEYNWKLITKKRLEKIEGYLKGEVETYNQYLTGEVYRYTITNDGTGEEIDSCGGFYGDNWEDNGLFSFANWQED